MLRGEVCALFRRVFVDQAMTSTTNKSLLSGAVIVGAMTLGSLLAPGVSSERMPHAARAAASEYVRFSKPEFLSFDELVTLEEKDPPDPQLAKKLEAVLTTPVVSNEAYFAGAKPKRPTSEALGPYLRAVMWNIERGIQFDPIRISLSEPEKFDEVLDKREDPKTKPLTSEQLKTVKEQLQVLQPADLLILNEVDYGVTRTDYRDVAGQLAKALQMNYAYGVEFLEIDPLFLGLEKVELEDKAAQEDIQHSFDVDKNKYLGMHGTAILSRYPIRSARLRPLPLCYDWYAEEKKGITKLEAGKRKGANLVFMERITREVRRGARTALIVELAVPESPTGAVTVVAPHLENKCKPACRQKQMAQILQWLHGERNPVIVGGDLNTTDADNAPTSVSKIVIERLKDPHKWALTAVKWATGAPTVLLLPVNYMRNRNDPTGFDVPVLSRKREAKLFNTVRRFEFEDGRYFDFRGDERRSAENRGGTLSDSNQRGLKGFKYTFALARTYGGLYGEFKLDWFFVKGLADSAKPSGGPFQFAPHFGQTLMELNSAPEDSLSDHAPITVDLPLTEPPPLIRRTVANETEKNPKQ